MVAEVAESTGTDSLLNVSDDGGLSFTQRSTAAGSDRASAWKIAADLDVGEWFGQPEKYEVHAYARELEPEFFSGGTFLEQGTRKAGKDTYAGGAGGITLPGLIDCFDQQIRAIVDQLLPANVANYVDLPDGVRVATVRRVEQPSPRRAAPWRRARPASRTASPKCGRAGARGRIRTNPARDSSTNCINFVSGGTNSRTASTHSCEFRTRSRWSTSIGVWLTTLRSCLWDQTSVSSGATLRSPTRMRAAPLRGRAAPHKAISLMK